ncbi:MAG: TonB-dependent receptor [Paludibacteraceae bacterium]|nr:TonB-dependent receptor [Paludibacteraceae bacterium]
MRKLFLSLTMLCAAGGLLGRDISGRVADANGPLPGADVVVKNSPDNYEVTDDEGNFEISVENGDVLEIVFSGYKTKTVKIDAKTSKLNIVLEEDAEELGEIEVNAGYGKMRKSDVTGALASVKGDALAKANTASVDQALAGKVSGVRVASSSGQPGESATVQIRGVSSLTGSNDPLYVVDGMPIGGGKQSSGANPLASINPNDILSMEVLKDASATAIYGSRAANGVIMITTKKGAMGEANKEEKVSVSYAGQFSVSSATDKLDLMNLNEFASYYTDPYISSCYNQEVDKKLQAVAQFGGAGTDWQDVMFHTAISHSHQLSLNGGSQKTQYAFSMGYMNQDGILINTDFQRFNGRLNMENQTKSWLRLGMNMSYTYITQTKQQGFEFADDNKLSGISNVSQEEAPYIQSLISSPATSPVDNDGKFVELGAEDQEIKMNPLRNATYSPIYMKRSNVIGQTFANITFLKDKQQDFSWRNEFGIDFSNESESCFTPSQGQAGNKQQFIDRENQYWRFCSTLNYSRTSTNKFHRMNAMLGYEAWKATWEGTTVAKSNYLDDMRFIDKQYQNTALGEDGPISGYKGATSMMSTFARVNYSFKDRYLVTATGRLDGSSTLAPEHRWDFFPSFSLAWNIAQEDFMKKATSTKKINQLKLRAGWGQTGNAGSNMAHVGYFKPFRTRDDKFGMVQGTWMNPDLVWETNWQLNAGVDVSFLNNRINLVFDAFYKQNNDLIVRAEPGPTLGSTADAYLYTSIPDINAGSIKNVGFDVNLTTTNVKVDDLGGNDFSWNSDLNISVVRNEVLELQSDSAVLEGKRQFKTSTRTYCVSKVGHAPGMFWGFKTDGLIQDEEQLGLYKRASSTDVGDINYVDINSDGVIDEDDKTFIGNPNPKFTFGFGNTLNWGPWSLNIFLSGSYGNDVYNLLRSKLEGMDRGGVNQLRTVLDCARVMVDEDGHKYIENSSTNMPRPNSVSDGGNAANVISDRYVEDASYLRIQSIGLSYNVPQKYIQKIKLNSMSVSFNVQNVATFTKYSGLNPEVPSINAINQGIDMGGYPLSRSYVVGLNFNF